MTRIDRNELRSLLLGETPCGSAPNSHAAGRSSETPAASADNQPSHAASERPTPPPETGACTGADDSSVTNPSGSTDGSAPSPPGGPNPRAVASSSATNTAFTSLHAELSKVLPTLWRRACEADPARGTPRERLLALLRWWAGKHDYQYLERVPVGADDPRRLDIVLQGASVRLALEVDARFSAASLSKLQAAHRAGYVVLVIWTTNAASREQARTLRYKVSDALGVRNLHWLPMWHAQWGWI